MSRSPHSRRAQDAAGPAAPGVESRTLFLILAEFGTGHIPVERCAHHFGMGPEEAKNAARRQQLPVPAFRLGSQKSPWLVSAQELANLIDERARRARDDWSRVQGAA